MAFVVRFINSKRLYSIHRGIQLYQGTDFNVPSSTRNALFQYSFAFKTASSLPMTTFFSNGSSYVRAALHRDYKGLSPDFELPSVLTSFCSLVLKKSILTNCHNVLLKGQHAKYTSNASVMLKTDDDIIRFSLDKEPTDQNGSQRKHKKRKMSRKAKLNELRFYRLKAKKKMRSPNPEVRITYRLEKAKRKEAWLIEKLRKFEVPKAPSETYDPEVLTEEDKFYLKRTGEKKKNYVPVGRRGVFGGVVLNMHLHWKRHETVKVVCKPCRPGQVQEYAEELARLSKGIVIDIKANNTIIFYRGKNYVQPKVMSPPDTLSKNKALEKYTYEQSLEHTSQFIEKLEKELEEYHKHISRYKKGKETASEDSAANI